jgi:hypothetical protein
VSKPARAGQQEPPKIALLPWVMSANADGWRCAIR